MVTWAVVLAGAATENAPELATAVRTARDAGYRGDIEGCDSGDGAVLGVSDDAAAYTVPVYFGTEDEARQALAAFRSRGFGGGGVGEVTLYCLD